jgi:adenylate cyclase
MVAEELGVQYVLEGSIQSSGDNLRITAQLIDAITGHYLWSERYDRHLDDIFALQDEITLKILTALQVKLTYGERTAWKGTNNLEAYLKCLQGYEHFSRHTQEGIARARQLAMESIALDPNYAGAYTLLGRTHMSDISYGWSKSRRESIDRALELAQKALALDDTHTAGRLLLSFIYREKGQYEKSIAEIERVIKLNPNSAEAYAHLAGRLYIVGRGEEAIASAEKAIRLNPMAPWFYWYWLGMGHWVLGQYEEAIVAYKEAVHRSPTALHPHVALTASHSLLGREEEARAEAKEVLRIHPKFSLDHYAKTLTLKDQSVIDEFVAGLRKAGLK